MKRYIINKILKILPGSRFYGFKRILLIWGNVKVAKNVRVMSIKVEGVELSIAENTFIGDETIIVGGLDSKVVIGKNCDISSRVSIVTGTHKLGNQERAAGDDIAKDIIIGDGVWIGYGTIILSGVTINSGSIVAAGSVVIRDVPRNCMVAGNPAVIKKMLW